ncbi:hypothetical protein Tco_0016222 [Tanacetum coccineum]
MKFILPHRGGIGLSPSSLRVKWVSILGYSITVAIGFLLQIFCIRLEYFQYILPQYRPFGAARISHFEVLTRVLDLGPSVAVFRAFYTRMYSDGLFSLRNVPYRTSCLSKPPDSIKNWGGTIFFWVDTECVSYFRSFVYWGVLLEKDPAPHLTARQEQAVQVLSSNKAPFRRYPECFLALVGLSPYYPFGENTYPAFEGPDRTDMGLLDYIRTANPRKVQAVEVQKGEEQVTLFDSIKHCFVSLDAPAAAQASGSGSGAGAEVSVSSAERNVVEENVIPEGAFLNPTDPECDVTVTEKDVAQRQPEKAKRKKLLKRSDPLPAKRLRTDHPSLVSGTGGKSLASLRQSLPEGSLTLGASSPADIPTHVTVPSSRVADAPVYTAADIVTSSRAATFSCDEPGTWIHPVFERGWTCSEVMASMPLVLITEKMEAQQEEQAQELYNRVAELEAHVMDVSGRLEGEFYPAYLTALAGRRWLLTHGMELAMVKCLKSPEYQGILGHALGRAVDYGMQEGLAAGHEHGIAGTPLSAVVAYNPETAKNNYLDAVRALEEVDFPLVHLLKSKKDSGMDEVLDCFLLDGPLANLPEAAHLQPCLEQLSVPIYHADVNAVAGETSLSFALLNVHTRAEGAKKHAAALRQLMVDIVSHPLSSQNLLGEASTSVVISCVEDLDTDEDLGSVVCMPHLEDPRFEILP